MAYTKYANQKDIIIQKNKNTSRRYSADKDADFAAMRDLGAISAAYILYHWLTMNADNYRMGLSGALFAEETGVSVRSYQRAVLELIDKGYLALQSGSTNTYIFYETPNDEEIETLKEPKIEYTKLKDKDEIKKEKHQDIDQVLDAYWRKYHSIS